MEEGVGADIRQALGSFLNLAFYTCTRPAWVSMRDEDGGVRSVWSVSSIWFVLLARVENQPEEPKRPDRPEGRLRGFVGGFF
jgi:hypothetical protein